MLYKITLSDLPDGYAMLLSYTYELESNIDTVYPNWRSYGYQKGVVTNTASLEGTSYKSAEYRDKYEYSNAGAGGGVYRDHALTIKKVESGKYYNVLPGAEFKLQQYDGTQFVDVEGKTYTTNEKGQFTIEKSGADYLTNTLYRLVEIIPPNGYALPENPEEEAVYFYFKDTADTAHILPTDIPAKAVDLNSQSKQVYVENEPNLTSVTVEKQWRNSDDTTLDNPPESSINFDLVQLVSSTPPSSGSSATVKESKTYTLTAANNWRMVIGNLPRSNLERTEYYSYKIVETTSMDGYKVTYNTESGVVGGYLVMVNTKTPEQEEPTYELPSTGSPGGTVPYTAGGAAIALAAVLCGYNSRRKRKRGEE